MGECPDWYPHIKAAKYLGVDPRTLPERSPWKDVAIAAMNAEARAQQQAAERARRKGSRRR